MPVHFATRVTWSGEYVHAAPWSVGSQGYDNVSHGCVGMSTGDAEWFFDTFHQGDLVEVVNSGGATMEPFGNGFGDWNLTWPMARGQRPGGRHRARSRPRGEGPPAPPAGLSRRTGPTVCPAGQSEVAGGIFRAGVSGFWCVQLARRRRASTRWGSPLLMGVPPLERSREWGRSRELGGAGE
ncbi:hypothetical protein SHIRM173S_04610 [Streptomyces hirsutus]